MQNRKILYGVCGIGNGHTFRQLPIIRHFADRGDRILIFAYDASYKYLFEYFKNYRYVSLEQVEVPYYKGKLDGLDFVSSASLPVNQKEFIRINCQAMARAETAIGRPDLVVSDYEPVCAQYAYAFDAPLVTIDQQSKYLIGDFPQHLNGQSYFDEVMRLRMFFPKAEKRLACSFFQVTPASASIKEKVEIVPPVFREELMQLKYSPHSSRPLLLVYLTAQQGLVQPLENIIQSMKSLIDVDFHIFLPSHVKRIPEFPKSLKFYYHGDERFEKVLSQCHGIVSTAGHTLLSEAMFLGIPVYAVPLDLYEQQMNAYVIGRFGFGINHTEIDSEKLNDFISQLSSFSKNIAQDQNRLLRRPGQLEIIRSLEACN